MEDPFTPGSAIAPPVLAGREGPLADFDEALHRLADPRPVRHLGITGAVGLGKTALLASFARSANEHQHATVMLRGDAGEGTGVLAQLAAQTPDLAAQIRPSTRHGRQVLRESITEVRAAVNLGVFSAEVQGNPNHRPTVSQVAATERALRVMASEAAERGRGMVFLVDDAQEAPVEDLRLLTSIVDGIGATRGNVVMVIAGTPDLRANGGEGQGLSSLAERFRWHDLEPLTREQTERAFGQPLEDIGLVVTDEAHQLAWEVTEGHPQVVQLLGSRTVADLVEHPAAAAVDRGRVQRASEAVTEDLNSGIHPARWNQLDRVGQRCARVIAALTEGSGHSTATVAAVADEAAVPIGVALTTLISHDAFDVNHDATTVRLAVPGLAEWIQLNRPSYEASKQPPETFRRLMRLIEHKAGRAELGLPPDPALEQAMVDAAAQANPRSHPWAERVRRRAGVEPPTPEINERGLS